MARDPIDLLHGTLDVLVLKTLSWGPMHGYGISRWIEERTVACSRSRTPRYTRRCIDSSVPGRSKPSGA
jgi:hypothetical protein